MDENGVCEDGRQTYETRPVSSWRNTSLGRFIARGYITEVDYSLISDATSLPRHTIFRPAFTKPWLYQRHEIVRISREPRKFIAFESVIIIPVIYVRPVKDGT